MKINKVKGTKDYFGKEAKEFRKVVSKISEIANNYSFEEIVTPTFENANLFSRTSGDSSDIVNKEMFTIIDRKERKLALKPEGTASTARLVLENKLVELEQKQKLYYISPMYRYERPQKGRQREFYQFGAEVFGDDSIYADIELIQLAISILDKLNISKYELQINSIGSSETRSKYSSDLVLFLENRKDQLSDDSKERLKNNPLRILDSKEDIDQELIKDAPKLFDYLTSEEKDRFEKTKELLILLDIKFKVQDNLIRGLDYYNDFVFEFVSTDEGALGAKSTLIAGGRYDKLISKLDENKNVPATGFAAGIERLILASNIEPEKEIFEYVILTDQGAEKEGLLLSNKLRNEGNKVLLDNTTKKLNKKLKSLSSLEIENLIVLGQEEIKSGEYTIKNYKTKEEKKERL